MSIFKKLPWTHHDQRAPFEKLEDDRVLLGNLLVTARPPPDGSSALRCSKHHLFFLFKLGMVVVAGLDTALSLVFYKNV